ncbi:uncharacterized protein LOC126744681 [Anthonomus grandis grandis]|uniref:uncharacterized protein LOC126744681 n=1 Tax=Anthonomus grandis grandis TaxID=2921223 RepID=UPI0021653BC4|nr:uncharacterized protein LOC126744681 [Anthonomus grandis grandis]
MRTKLKTEKWEEIAKEVDMKTGTEAKALWEKLRHSLRDAIRRQQKYLKSGSPAEVIKEWKIQKQMGFLQPYMANKSREGNLREDGENQNLIQDSEQDIISADVDNANIEVNTQQQDESVEDEIQPQILPETFPLTSTTTPISNATPKLAKKCKKNNVAAMMKYSMEKREERSKAKRKRDIMCSKN